MASIKISKQATNSRVIPIAKEIKKLGIVDLSIICVAWVFAICFITTSFIYFNNLDDSTNFSPPYMSVVFGILFWVSTSIYYICNLVFNIIAIVKISNTDWEYEELNQSKSSYWIVCLILMFIPIVGIVSPILWIVWSNKVIKMHKLAPKQD